MKAVDGDGKATWPLSRETNWANDITSCNQKAGRLCVAMCDMLEVHELQGRHKLPNQESSKITSQRFHLIRFQGWSM